MAHVSHDQSGFKMALFTSNYLLLVVLLPMIIIPLSQANKSQEGNGTFTIDYANNTFLKDGKPFRYVSGSYHYSRVHPGYWKDRLLKTRAAGINAIQVYVPWNVHELSSGMFHWDGSADLPKFLSLAKETNLTVLLRLGPYICGEWEFGGFPAWLLNANSSMVLRTSDPTYIKYVDRWYSELLKKIKPFMYNNGGPILMVQVENEYGSYFACDFLYLRYLRDKVQAELGESTVIYTTDGDSAGYLRCGKFDGAYATVDFGVTYDAVKAFQPQRAVEPNGPLVNSEFYTGWLDHWGSPHSTHDAVSLAKSLDLLLNYSANVNMYMFVGGTNFGFTNGANSPAYHPVPTSYDYDAPISEAGDITLKYYALRDVISKYLPLPDMPIPSNTTKAKIGAVPLEFVMTIQDALKYLTPEGPTKSSHPVSMEAIKFYDGFILYRFVLQKDYSLPTPLSTKGVRDRAVVMVNGAPFGTLDREDATTVSITGSAGQQVDILVENTGRINYGSKILFNTKGIIEDVILGGEVVKDWEIYPLHLENIDQLLLDTNKMNRKLPQLSASGNLMTPAIYTGILEMHTPQDTFLDPTSWGKGQAIINGFNLGRYWPGRGPQVTLYVPAPAMAATPKSNQFFMFEVENAPCFQSLKSSDTQKLAGSQVQDGECQVVFTDVPTLNGPNGPGSFSFEKATFSKGYNDPELHLVH